ncbi:hypothetical protein BGX34_010794 [Mortierella sp. NVP85]|nr:hypothetical protein BGX34_010794 [Mortierella sp. NVP85]
MTRQDPSEIEGKASRSCLASAPLRLLSHSFHSTANSHNASSSSSAAEHSRTISLDNPTKESATIDSYDLHHSTALDDPLGHESCDSMKQDLQTQESSVHIVPHHPYYHQHHQQHQQPTQQRVEDEPDYDQLKQSITEPRPCSISLQDVQHGEYEALSKSRPPRKKAVVDMHSQSEETMRAPTVTRPPHTVVLQATDGKAMLERLLLPYDIRYSIFGRLSLQDIYNCQLTCRLLHWATSDQFIWKRIALDLIQGEFYFDIPRALPATLPSWKYFCKRHLLRQRNWRRGHVQDVISLDDNYEKLTTLQIMAPYVLTGCDDGRIHLWNINTRTLEHRFQIRGEITWVEHLQEARIVAGLGYDIDNGESEIRLFSTETGREIGFYKERFWNLAICAINNTYLVASNGEGRFTAWEWRTGDKVSEFTVVNEASITEALYLVRNTILELHYDGLIRLFSIQGECYGRFTLDNILPNHQVSFCWLHNDYSMVVWEESNTMAHIRLPLLVQDQGKSSSGQTQRQQNTIDRPITQEEWDAQGAEVYWRHQLEHTCNFAAMGGGRYQLLYVQIFENLMDHVPIRVHSLKHNGSKVGSDGPSTDVVMHDQDSGQKRKYGEYVTAHSLKPELEKIIQGLRPSRIDCDPEFIVVGLVRGGVRLLQFAPVDEELFGEASITVEEDLTD